jgi:hypothetical protein
VDISALIEQASPQDKVRITVYHNAVVKCTQAYQGDSTAAKMRDLRAAEEALARAVAEITAGVETENETGEEEQEDIFNTRLDAWQYLQDSGWQIGRSQFYQHCKEGRLLRDRTTKKYLQAAVDKYAQLHCRLAETGEKVNDKLGRMAEDKATTELEREKVRLEKDQHDLAVRKGEYVPRDEVELMIIGRAIAMLAHLKAMVQMQSGNWIELVEGNQERAQELIGSLNRSIEEHLATFARDIEFDVILERNAVANGEQGE